MQQYIGNIFKMTFFRAERFRADTRREPSKLVLLYSTEDTDSGSLTRILLED